MRDENINDTIGTRMVRKTIVDYVFNLITENKSKKSLYYSSYGYKLL